MIFSLLVLACALFISAIAAWYSIAGLIAIFATSPLHIALMGGGLEAGKLIAASWLYKNWKEAPAFLKYYLTFAVVVLMFITSLGIFGFLSKAHIESNTGFGENTVQLKVLEQREQITKERLQYLLMRAGDDPSRIARATNQAIQDTQNELIEIQREKLPLMIEQNSLMAEVGPLKYIAELIYGQEAEDNFDSAVRFVIILLIFVFDPLAVLLVIAANYSLRRERESQDVPTEPLFADMNAAFDKEDFEKGLDKITKKTKIDITSLEPIPMDKEEIERKTKLER
jgi:hypothetical protein